MLTTTMFRRAWQRQFQSCRHKMMLSSLVAVSLGAVHAPHTFAHEPNAVSWQVLQAEDTGYFEPDINKGGDTRLYIELLANLEGMKGPFLVSFDQCAQDVVAKDKPVKNLEELIHNPKAKPIYIDEKPQEPRWQVCADKKNILVEGRQELALSLDFIRPVSEGMAINLPGNVYVIPEKVLGQTDDPDKLAELMQREHAAAKMNINLFYRLDARKRTWLAGDYEKVFGSASEGPKVTRDYERVLSQMPVNLDAYLVHKPLPKLEKLRPIDEVLEIIYKEGSGIRKVDDRIGKINPVKDFWQIDTLYKQPQSLVVKNRFPPVMAKNVSNYVEVKDNKSDVLSAGNDGDMDADSGASHTLTGRFSTRWSSDHALHSGFGFRAEAWTNETGSWKKLASDWVQSNGTWTINVPSSKGYNGNHLRILYRSYNTYYRPQNQDGDTYSWRDPDQYNIGSNFNAGHRYADTDGGEYNGVGELVDAAMYLWSRLYWKAGVNPVASDPVEMNFPNTWYDCGDGSGSPWSCATRNGDKIWLIASHGTQADVVVHELAHALQAKFWDKKWPDNSGGSHTLSGCYPSRLGMALTEGFANFLPAWTGYQSRNVAEGNFGSGRWALAIDPERSNGSPNCSNGWENETWVARTFWDLHDTRADGDDILWFNHMGAVINLYLGNPVSSNGDAMDMRDFENIYRNAASAGHQGFISDIFNQNRM